MSNYTTEVRFICDHYYDNSDMPKTGTIDEKIAAGAKGIFEDEFKDYWTTYDPDHKETLEKLILKHYYFDEIGCETVPMWQFRINQKLAEIMNKYNQMYKFQEEAYATPFLDYWQAERGANKKDEDGSNNEIANATQSTSQTQSTTSDQGTTQHTASTSEQTSDNTGTSESSAAGTSTTDSSTTSTTDTDAWQKYSDTPQGGLTGLQNDTYLTNATHNLNNGTTSGTDAATGSTSTTNKSNTTGSQTASGSNDQWSTNDTAEQTDAESNAKTDSDSTRESKSKIATAESYLKVVKGRTHGSSYYEDFKNFYDAYINIDMMIIAELETLFMGVY